jgi:hypothetical protein
VNVAGDVDFAAAGDRKSTLHLGTEIWPVNMLALRIGVDQDPTPGGVVSNLTAGVGLRIGDLSFDYAYHSYYNVPENATSFFSISMVGLFEQRKPRTKFTANLESPKDNVVTYSNKVELKGNIDDLRPGDRVEVNGKAIKLNDDGAFKADLVVDSLGVKRVMVSAIDEKGHKVSFKRDIFKLASFKDVANTHWAKKSIELLATAGLVSGYPDGSFRPEKALSRAELAAMLVKAKNIPLPDKAQGLFPDVPRDNWAAVYVEAASQAGLMKGYPDRSFRPNQTINKAEGVTVMARLEGLDEIAQDLKENVEDSRFTDIKDNWAAGYILAVDDAGMLEYMGEATKFNPNIGFTRSEAVEILAKTTLGQDRVKALVEGSDNSSIVNK